MNLSNPLFLSNPNPFRDSLKLLPTITQSHINFLRETSVPSVWILSTAMAVDSGPVSKRGVSGKKRIKSPQKESKSRKSSESGENVIPSSPAKRNKSPGVRFVGGRIYDPVNGKTCHQCRQKTRDFVAACTNQSNKPCPIMFCHKCLLNRYGEKAEEVVGLGEWSCPKCRGICNCSICMKKRGHQPTGILINTAKATGFSSVSEMLLKGAENFTDLVASPKKEAMILPRKRGKENSFDGKVDANSPYPIDIKSKTVKEVNFGNTEDDASMKIISQGPTKRKTRQEQPKDMRRTNRNIGDLPRETGLLCCEKKAKKMKLDRLDELNNGLHEMNNKSLGSRTSPRKLKVNNKMSNPGKKLKIGVDPKENVNTDIITSKEDFVQPFENEKNKKEEERNIANIKNVLKDHIVGFHAEMPLPLGRELTSVAGIDVSAEDVGNALQFVEFCSVFGEILAVRKRQPEHILQDLLHGRTGRRGKFSLTVQFHIHLLSFILTDQGEDATLGPSSGKNSWFHALKKHFSESRSVHKVDELESLDKAADYETLDTSKKLRLLNILCDEVLATEKVRNWIDDQNTKVAENIKEARQKVVAAKDKEKSLKQKMHDDIAEAIIARHGAPLSISEHEAIVSNIKAEAALAHAKVLESNSMFLNNNQTSDAVRIEPLFIGHNGHAYWKLNYFGKSNVLCQNVGTEEPLTLDEKWFAIDVKGKEAIEKHICSLRGKRRRSSRGFKCPKDTSILN